MVLIDRISKVYFGFTHCPDICPDELDKMAKMIDLVRSKVGNVLRPIFISCDPARDTPAVVKSYLREFHPDLIGLTGDYEQVKATCKAYRVYFSTPPDVKPGQDYLVDHSIYFYLMGEFRLQMIAIPTKMVATDMVIKTPRVISSNVSVDNIQLRKAPS